MKKLMYLLAVLLPLGFVSCEEDDGNPNDGGSVVTEIVATDVVNVPDGTYIATVKAFPGNYYDMPKTIAEAEFENNGFTLLLPETVSDEYLEQFPKDMPPSFNISDENANMFILSAIGGFNRNNNFIGEFDLDGEIDNGYSSVDWMYADRDVIIKGENHVDPAIADKYDWNLKKGWNVVYRSQTDTGYLYTSQKPSGINFQWTFYYYGEWLMSPQSPQKAPSIFQQLRKK
jgi:hypothetical protein